MVAQISWRCSLRISKFSVAPLETKRDEVCFTDPKNQTIATQKSDLLGHGDPKWWWNIVIFMPQNNHLFLTKQREGFHPKDNSLLVLLYFVNLLKDLDL